jgi:hypothetical protein
MRAETLSAYDWFQAAIRASGGRAPIGSNGREQVWDEHRGWHDASSSDDDSSSAVTMTTSGDGWRVSSSPRWPHRDLESLAESIARIVFPWGTSADWQWRFGVLEGRYADLAALTLYRHRLVIVDEAKLASRCDIERDLQETIVHEASHIQVGLDDGPDDPAGEPLHSNQFYRVLNEARSKCPRVIAGWTRVRRAVSG